VTKVIRFLETMGANATAARMSIVEYQAAVALLDANESERTALRSRDHLALVDSLSLSTKMWCFVVAPDDHEEKSPGESQDGDEIPSEPDQSHSQD
jgi:hypothetical protein